MGAVSTEFVPPWRFVTSRKPARQGEAFLLRGEVFTMKIYRDAAPDVEEFAGWLVDQLNDVEQRRFERMQEEGES